MAWPPWILTCAHWSTAIPAASSSTSPCCVTRQHITIITGVGRRVHEGGSRGCVNCSISWVTQSSTVNNYIEDIQIKSRAIYIGIHISIHDILLQTGSSTGVQVPSLLHILIASPVIL